MSEFKVIAGNRDVVETLEELLVKARFGELEGVVVCCINRDQTCCAAIAYNDDAEFPWSRLVASVAGAHHHLLVNGLPA